MRLFSQLGLLVSLLSFITSCGEILEKLDDIKDRDGNKRQFETSNPVFNELANRFEAEGKAYLNQPSFSIGDIPINFGDTEGTAVGVCFKYSNGQREIIIDQQRWETLPSIREPLIYHELGHCRLNRGHDNSVTEDGFGNGKLSILNEILISGSQYETYRDAYVKELFTTDKADIRAALAR